MSEHAKSERQRQEALEKGTTPERVAQGHAPETPERSVKAAEQLQGGPLQDGYRLNEGEEYDQAGPGQEGQEYYDPAHSGVRHAANKPGKRTNTPGREEGTAWGEHIQSGDSAPTTGRKNPAD